MTSTIVKKSYLPNSLSKANNIINCAKHFPNFIVGTLKLIEKYHVSPKKLMKQGISNPEFYVDLVYKFKRIIGNPNFSDLFKCIVNRFKRARYTLDIMRQTACLVLTQLCLNAMLHSQLHGGGSGLRLNDGFDMKLLILG